MTMVYAFSAEAVIDASPERVWAVLTDLQAYPDWNPFTRQVRTTLRPGDPVRMQVWMGRRVRLWQTETVRVVQPPERLVWALDIGADWLIWARREQTLTVVEGGTLYRTVDEIGGLLAPLVNLLFGRSLDRGFRGVADGLRERLEKG